MNLIVKTASEDDVRELKAAFQAIDTDGTGMIQAEELSSILRQKQMNMSGNEVQEMISQMDYQGNQMINYSEFLAATIDVQNFLTDSKLKAIFKQFDTDSSGVITAENIMLAMQKLGKEMSLQEVESMISQHDIAGDKVLNYDEFRRVFFTDQEIAELDAAPATGK